MTISTVLEVALGLVLFFYILSMIVQSITGKIDEWMAYRAKDLEEVLRDLLTSTDSDKASEVTKLAEQFKALKENPLIQNLVPRPHDASVSKFRKGRNPNEVRLPGKIPAKTFALALFDTLVPEEGDGGDLAQVRAAVASLPEGETRKSLLALIDASDNSIKDAREKVESWFNDSMKRVSALYRVHTRRISFLIAAILILVVDADAISVAQNLWNEPTLRAAVDAETQQIIDNGGTTAEVTAQFESLDALNFPIFTFWQERLWEAGKGDQLLQHILGWIVSWFALSLGASFWYDMMKRIKGEDTAPAAGTT